MPTSRLISHFILYYFICSCFVVLMSVGPFTSHADERSVTDGTQDEFTCNVIHEELCKWVKRATVSATIISTLLISWGITFQINRDTFGPRWFVMSQDEGEKTGW